jgi:hypothetical protein
VATYRVLRGIDYPPSRRAEAGDIVSDIPERSVKWMIASGVIAEVEAPKPAPRAKKGKALVDAEAPVVFDEPVPVYDEEELD